VAGCAGAAAGTGVRTGVGADAEDEGLWAGSAGSLERTDPLAVSGRDSRRTGANLGSQARRGWGV